MGLLLEKKIQELETQLTPLLVSPAGHEPESTGDIQAKFGFLNNLLAREIEVNSQNNTEHLGHVAGRLALLEAAFHNWNNSHAYINNNHNKHLDDDDVHVHDDGDLLLKTIIPDCSCTHSCLIDDDDDENEEVQEENDKIESDEKFKRNEEKEEEEEEDDDDDGEKKEVFEKNSVEFRRFGGVVVVVVMVVVVVLAVAMKIWVVEEEDFLVPT